MSCCNSCGRSPCCCGGVNPTVCCTPTTESVEYTAENVNLIGVGVLNGTTGTNFEFRGIASDTLALTVTLDAPNNAIIISFNDDLLIDDIPTFTETIRGIGEAATQAETNAGIVDNVIVTPLKLQNRTATETRAGIAEIATQAQVTTGTDDTTIITPLKLATFASSQLTTRVFADAASRGGATPAFIGQFGGQQDNDTAWIGSAVAVGQWLQIAVSDRDFDLGPSSPTWTIPSATWTIDGSGNSGSLVFNQCDAIVFNQGSAVIFDNTPTEFTATSVNFASNATIQASGVTVPANSVLLAGINPGQLSSALRNTFLSTANVQVYGLPSGTLARTTFATYAGQTVSNPPTQAEVQAIDDALRDNSRRLGALITDLMATLKPNA